MQRIEERVTRDPAPTTRTLLTLQRLSRGERHHAGRHSSQEGGQGRGVRRGHRDRRGREGERDAARLLWLAARAPGSKGWQPTDVIPTRGSLSHSPSTSRILHWRVSTSGVTLAIRDRSELSLPRAIMSENGPGFQTSRWNMLPSVLTSCVPPLPGCKHQPTPILQLQCCITLHCIWHLFAGAGLRLASLPAQPASPASQPASSFHCPLPSQAARLLSDPRNQYQTEPIPGIRSSSHLPHRSFDVKLHLLPHERPHLQRAQNKSDSYVMHEPSTNRLSLVCILSKVCRRQ